VFIVQDAKNIKQDNCWSTSKFQSINTTEEIVQQHLQHHGGNWKNTCFYGVIIGELTRGHQKFQVKLEQIENTVVEILAGNLRYKKQITLSQAIPANIDREVDIAHKDLSDDNESSSEEEDSDNADINISSIGQASPYEFLCRYLPINYIRQNVINSINIRGREIPNWIDVTFREYMSWLGLWVLISAFPVADRHFYWRTMQELTKPMTLFNFQCWISLAQFEQIISYHTLEMPHELEVPNLSDPLYSVHNFVNAFNNNLIEAVKPGSTLCIDESINSWLGGKNKISGHRKIPRKPHPIGQEWKTFANSSTNIIIQLEPCEDKEIEKTKQYVSDYNIGNSWFGSPKVCIALMQNGLYGIFHIKKRREWPLNYPRDMVQKLD
ncbi:30657_t:CDS:2, partial [Gigaspora margarita]